VEQTPERAVLACVIYPQEGYPFTLSLTVGYVLSATGLSVRLTATNIGSEPCPYGAGAHPYIAVGQGSVDVAMLQVPASAVLVNDERAIPVGSKPVEGTLNDFRELRAIGEVCLDTCFTGLARASDGLARVLVRDGSGSWTTVLWMDESFPFVMVFTGDTLGNPLERRRGIAVEPMTCAPNAFNSGDGLRVLEPGESTSGAWGIDPFGGLCVDDPLSRR
jgi:aldose 1-epimerase